MEVADAEPGTAQAQELRGDVTEILVTPPMSHLVLESPDIPFPIRLKGHLSGICSLLSSGHNVEGPIEVTC